MARYVTSTDFFQLDTECRSFLVTSTRVASDPQNRPHNNLSYFRPKLWLGEQDHQPNESIKPVNSNRQPTTARPYNSRIPILVATTTARPRRIPITTPAPTTAAAVSTTQSAAAAAASTADQAMADLAGEDPAAADISRQQQESRPLSVTPASAGGPADKAPPLSSPVGGQADDLETPPDDDMPPSEYCPSTVKRNLVWKYTRRGSEVVQPCPNGATGLARWRCQERDDVGEARATVVVVAGQPARWSTAQPDMSDCKSAAITNLEVKLRQADPENVIASSLAHLTGGSRRLYGGDLESAAEVMKTVANKIQYLLQQRRDKFYKKEAYIQVI